MDSYAHLGVNVRYFRTLCALSQQELARLTAGGLSQRNISDIEYGRRPSDPSAIDALAAALGVSREALLRRPRVVRDVSQVHPIVIAAANERVLVPA